MSNTNKCPTHPKYKAINKPRDTHKHPEGCKMCWEIYNDKKSIQEVKKNVLNNALPNNGPVPGKLYNIIYIEKDEYVLFENVIKINNTYEDATPNCVFTLLKQDAILCFLGYSDVTFPSLSVSYNMMIFLNQNDLISIDTENEQRLNLIS